jgi:hypothetical protein
MVCLTVIPLSFAAPPRCSVTVCASPHSQHFSSPVYPCGLVLACCGLQSTQWRCVWCSSSWFILNSSLCFWLPKACGFEVLALLVCFHRYTHILCIYYIYIYTHSFLHTHTHTHTTHIHLPKHTQLLKHAPHTNIHIITYMHTHTHTHTLTHSLTHSLTHDYPGYFQHTTHALTLMLSIV